MYIQNSTSSSAAVQGDEWFANAPSTFSGNKLALRTKTSLSSERGNNDKTRFERECAIWKKDTEFLSSLHEKYLHSSYAGIIGMGRAALPFIFESMKNEPDDWFYALRSITGENPVTDDMAGDMKWMTATWLAWGAEKGLA